MKIVVSRIGEMPVLSFFVIASFDLSKRGNLGIQLGLLRR